MVVLMMAVLLVGLGISQGYCVEVCGYNGMYSGIVVSVIVGGVEF